MAAVMRQTADPHTRSPLSQQVAPSILIARQCFLFTSWPTGWRFPGAYRRCLHSGESRRPRLTAPFGHLSSGDRSSICAGARARLCARRHLTIWLAVGFAPAVGSKCPLGPGGVSAQECTVPSVFEHRVLAGSLSRWHSYLWPESAGRLCVPSKWSRAAGSKWFTFSHLALD